MPCLLQVQQLRRVPGSKGDQSKRDRPIRRRDSQQPSTLPHSCSCTAASARVTCHDGFQINSTAHKGWRPDVRLIICGTICTCTCLRIKLKRTVPYDECSIDSCIEIRVFVDHTEKPELVFLEEIDS